MNLEELKQDCAYKQKKGLHFILASIVIWTIVSIIHMSALPILSKNLFTFCSTSILLPLSFALSKLLKIDFNNKENPLSKLGLLFSLNQMLYLLIAMWVYSAVPDKMLMVLAMIFGAHLLPYGWLYNSKAYTFMSVIISIYALVIGNIFDPYILALSMIVFEIVFSVLLINEVKKAKQ